jgi:hypothetical protein
MDLGEYMPKSTIPVAVFDAVPIRAIGGAARRRGCGRLLQWKDTILGRVHRLGVAVKEGVEHRQLELDGGKRGIGLRLPCA